MKSLALPSCLALAALFVAPGALAQNTPCTSTADCAADQECVDGACVESRPAPTACTTDADCGDGQFCAIYPCAAPCDADDPTCEPIECDGGGECVDEVPPPPSCTTDEDCGDGNVCLTGTVDSCVTSGCACPDDGDGDPANDPPCDCDEPAPAECTTETYSYCGPRYLADCAIDADCGPGFVCVVHDGCDCAIDSAGNETCDCPTEPGTAPPGVCELIRVECAADADCANDFVCVDEPQPEPCFVDDGGNTVCDEVEATKVCLPPDYAVGAPVSGEARDGVDNAVDGAADDVPTPGDDTHVHFSCAQGSAGGALPLAALALLLRRRRR